MKVVIADFDKTLFDSNYEDNVKAVNKFKEDDNVFVIATGRNMYSLKDDLRDIKFDYIICNDGGTIYDKSLYKIYEKNISTDVIKPIFDFLKRDISVGNPIIDLQSKYSYEISGSANAIIARIIDQEKALKTLNYIKTTFDIGGYISDRWLNLTDKSVNKGNALKEVCRLIGYDVKDVYAIGDNYNDICMCRLCKGVAMENATDDLKKVCKITVDCVEDFLSII